MNNCKPTNKPAKIKQSNMTDAQKRAEMRRYVARYLRWVAK